MIGKESKLKKENGCSSKLLLVVLCVILSLACSACGGGKDQNTAAEATAEVKADIPSLDVTAVLMQDAWCNENGVVLYFNADGTGTVRMETANSSSTSSLRWNATEGNSFKLKIMNNELLEYTLYEIDNGYRFLEVGYDPAEFLEGFYQGSAAIAKYPNHEALLAQYMQIDCFCVDDSYVDAKGGNLKIVYLFCTLNAKAKNLRVTSTEMSMIINNTNRYNADKFGDSKYTPSYYNGSYVRDIYMGESKKILITFKVPSADLAPGRAITLDDYNIPNVNMIKLSTDDLVHFDSYEAMAAEVDSEGYAKQLELREPADAETEAMVKKAINGYYWTFYVNNTSYKIEFFAPDKFTVSTGFGSNSGTYTVCKGYVNITYSSNDKTVEIPYSWGTDDIDLDLTTAFDVHE